MSDGTPRERPRPKYGEYATPQDQAEAIAGSLPPVSPLLTPRPDAGTVDRGEWAAPQVPDRSGAAASAHSSLDPASRPRRTWDIVLSVALLAYGLITTLSSFATFSDLGALLDQVYALQGIGDFSSDDLASTVGIVINVLNVVVLAVTAAITVRVLRARRLAFYIPLAGGALAVVLILALLFAAVVGDPAFVEYATSAG